MAAVDLSKVPAPDAVETFTFEQIKAEMLADLTARAPGQFTALVESDTAYKIIEVCAYREVKVRQRANNAVKANMLAFAKGSDLDQLGANDNVPRLVITPADPNASPPVAAVMEDDEAYRARIQLSFEGYTTAGSEGSYRFHALSASGDVLDVKPLSPEPGVAEIRVLSRAGNGAPSQATLDAVTAALSKATVRPLTDNTRVVGAEIVEYDIVAELVLYPGPDGSVILQEAEASAQAYADSIRRIGYDVSMSGVDGALHRPGVQNVVRTSPAALIPIDDTQAAYCRSVTVTVRAATDE